MQSLGAFVPTERKIRFIRDLVDAGLREIEVASFVNPARVQQMSDGAAVLAGLPRPDGVRYSALVPNLRGLEDALDAGVHRICVLTAASETFQRLNLNASIEESLGRVREIVSVANGEPVTVRGYVSCMVECPYEGPTDRAMVADLAGRLVELGCEDVFLADTIGRGRPTTVAPVVDAVLECVPGERLGVHLHDTYGQALANLGVCFERGIRRVDSSVAGLGGCPFAPGAAGNVATEDVLFWIKSAGGGAAIDLARLASIGLELCKELEIPAESKAARALVKRLETHAATVQRAPDEPERAQRP